MKMKNCYSKLLLRSSDLISLTLIFFRSDLILLTLAEVLLT